MKNKIFNDRVVSNFRETEMMLNEPPSMKDLSSRQLLGKNEESFQMKLLENLPIKLIQSEFQKLFNIMIKVFLL